MPGWVLAWNGKPENFPLEEDGLQGREFDWWMTKYFRGEKAPLPGEPFLLWRTDYAARRQIVVARGEVISPEPYKRDGRWWMTVRVHDDSPAVADRDELRSDPVLTNGGTFTGCGLFNSRGSNHQQGPYRLTDDEWVSLLRHLRPHGG